MKIPRAHCPLQKERGLFSSHFPLSLMLLLGAAGLTFDVGRMYIARSEAQSFCDAAALYAAWKLNGKLDGIAAARAAALATPKKWEVRNPAVRSRPDHRRVCQDLTQVHLVRIRTPPTTTSTRGSVTNVPLPMYLMPVADRAVPVHNLPPGQPPSRYPSPALPTTSSRLRHSGSCLEGRHKPLLEPPYRLRRIPTAWSRPARGAGCASTIISREAASTRSVARLIGMDPRSNMCQNDRTDQQYQYRDAERPDTRAWFYLGHQLG